MTLSIYESPDPSLAFSEDSEFTNPIRFAVDGRVGGVIYRRLFVRNSSSTYKYTGITVTPVDVEGSGIVDGSNGFSFKMKAGQDNPLEDEWDTIVAGAAISLDDISDVNTYLPFWVRIKVPKGADINSYTDVKFRISSTKILVS